MFEHKLLLLSEDFPPSVGGLQSYVSGLWQALPPAHSFAVVGSQAGDQAWDVQQAYQIVRASTRAWTYPRWKQFLRAARDVVRQKKIEAIFCGKALFEGRVALRLQKEFGIPFAVATYETEILVWLQHSRTRRQLVEVLTAAGRITVINEDMKQRLLELGIPEHKIVKLYPGVAEHFFSPVDGVEKFQAQYRLAGKRVVTCVARLVARKGVVVLLEAHARVLREVPQAHLLLVGDGPERAQLAAHARALGIEEHVTFLGRVSSEDVRRAIAVADVFALLPLTLPTDAEGFGIVYTEAAAMGVPSVGTRTGGIPEAVLDGETGLLVPERDADATAHALLSLLRDEDLRTRLADAARMRADKEFHWKGRALVFQGMMHSLFMEQDPRS